MKLLKIFKIFTILLKSKFKNILSHKFNRIHWANSEKEFKFSGFLALKDHILQESGSEDEFISVMQFIAIQALRIEELFPENRIKVMVQD